MMMRLTEKRRDWYYGKQNIMECHSTTYKQMGVLSPKHLRYRGFAMAWTALVITVLLLIVGLSLDTAKLAYNLHQLQNAVDAAALAGAQIVKDESQSNTCQFTHDLGFANTAERLEVTLRLDPQQLEPFTQDENQFDILLGRWVRYNHTFVPTLDAPNAVKAVARRNADFNLTEPALRALNLVFGPIVGIDDANALTLAVAWDYGSGGAGLICLSEPVPGGRPGLQIGGNSYLDIDDGGIHVNSTAFDHNLKDAGYIQNGAEIDAGFVNVVGGTTPNPDDPEWVKIFDGMGYSVLDKTTFPAPEHIDDPLAANMVDEELVDYNPYKLPDLVYSRLKVPELIYDGTLTTFNIPTVTSSMTLSPGYYPNGIILGNEDVVTLVPTSDSGLGTIFVFGGGVGQPGSLGSGITMTGGRLEGYGVTCYVTKNFDTDVCGVIDMTGGALELWSPGDWTNEENDEFNLSLVQGLNGIAIWQDPTMVYPQGGKLVNPDVKLTGNGDFLIAGTLYFPDPIHAFLRGDLGDTGNQILCGSAKLEGGAKINVNYDGRNAGESGNFCLVR